MILLTFFKSNSSKKSSLDLFCTDVVIRYEFLDNSLFVVKYQILNKILSNLFVRRIWIYICNVVFFNYDFNTVKM